LTTCKEPESGERKTWRRILIDRGEEDGYIALILVGRRHILPLYPSEDKKEDLAEEESGKVGSGIVLRGGGKEFRRFIGKKGSRGKERGEFYLSLKIEKGGNRTEERK